MKPPHNNFARAGLASLLALFCVLWLLFSPAADAAPAQQAVALDGRT